MHGCVHVYRSVDGDRDGVPDRLLLNLGAHALSEGYCSCSVCMYVYLCVCIRSNLSLHTLESQKRDTDGFIAIQEEPVKSLPILLKMLRSKVMA